MTGHTDLVSWAVGSNLPLISITTRDRINLKAVLKHLTGATAINFSDYKTMVEADPDSVKEKLFLASGAAIGKLSKQELYRAMTEAGSVLIVYNQDQVAEEFFNAGELPTPADLVLTFLSSVMAPAAAQALLPSLGGLTMKEIAEVYRLTGTRDGEVTSKGIGETRKALFQPARGIALVDTTQGLYWPQQDLVAYAGASNQHFFMHDEDNPLLRPRGLMLKGMPGVGKTEFAKYLANQWNVPLYRLSVEFGGKYVSESENNFVKALNQVDAEEPCILLWDEIEKMMGGNKSDSSGTTQKVLSQALWWLQEHRSRVLSIMTSNDLTSVPPELYREGRIDSVLELVGLDVKQAASFAEQLIDTFKFDAANIDPYDETLSDVKGLFKKQVGTRSDGEVEYDYDDTLKIAHGDIKGAVIRSMKRLLTPSQDTAEVVEVVPAATENAPAE